MNWIQRKDEKRKLREKERKDDHHENYDEELTREREGETERERERKEKVKRINVFTLESFEDCSPASLPSLVIGSESTTP